jgi:hypothetical protein
MHLQSCDAALLSGSRSVCGCTLCSKTSRSRRRYLQSFSERLLAIAVAEARDVECFDRVRGAARMRSQAGRHVIVPLMRCASAEANLADQVLNLKISYNDIGMFVDWR